MKHRTDFPDIEYKTKKQWIKLGFFPKETAKGTELWCNPHHNNHAIYYVKDEVRPITEKELEAVRAERRERDKKYREPRKRKEASNYFRDMDKAREDGIRACREEVSESNARSRKAVKTLLQYMAGTITPPAFENPSKTVVFDVETTGLNDAYDEVLQLAIIDGDENVLYNTYVKPYFMTSWEDAERVHGITPEMVENAPYPHEILADAKAIFTSAELIIGYNMLFDIGFLRDWGLDFNIPSFDVSENFAPIYGEWDEYHQDYRFKNLSTCAAFFGYEFQAHDALEDVKATLHCYKKMIEREKKNKIEESN